MASIHRAFKQDKVDLSKVFIPAKITIIKPEAVDEIIPFISRFSNTQNKVNEADFSSNDPFHVEIERLSEKIWCDGEKNRWFYERARGQYQVARQKFGTTPKRIKQFELQTPRSNKFDKSLLAKYMNIFNMIPQIVSLGNQKNFVYFMKQINENNYTPDEKYYKNLIAIAIIVKSAEKIARQYKFPSYRAQTTTYTVALIFYRTQSRVNLNSIWKKQAISEALYNTILNWMPNIRDDIIESAGQKNVTEWCKKVDCWRYIQNIKLELSDELKQELSKGQPLPTVGSGGGKTGESLTHLDRENIAKVMQLSDQEWMTIHTWAAMNEKHSSWTGVSLTLAGYAANKWQNVPSAKQAKLAVKMIKEMNDTGILEDQ